MSGKKSQDHEGAKAPKGSKEGEKFIDGKIAKKHLGKAAVMGEDSDVSTRDYACPTQSTSCPSTCAGEP